jgi:hypothetical protein
MLTGKMYIMSSLPSEKQSLGGGIFNTVTKLCVAVGLAISSSVYNAESTSSAALQTSSRPYNTAFWVCAASAGLGVCLVPFLTIGTQGHSAEEKPQENPRGGSPSTANSNSRAAEMHKPADRRSE